MGRPRRADQQRRHRVDERLRADADRIGSSGHGDQFHRSRDADSRRDPAASALDCRPDCQSHDDRRTAAARRRSRLRRFEGSDRDVHAIARQRSRSDGDYVQRRWTVGHPHGADRGCARREARTAHPESGRFPARRRPRTSPILSTSSCGPRAVWLPAKCSTWEDTGNEPVALRLDGIAWVISRRSRPRGVGTTRISPADRRWQLARAPRRASQARSWRSTVTTVPERSRCCSRSHSIGTSPCRCRATSRRNTRRSSRCRKRYWITLGRDRTDSSM